jgi:steroid delta-isomerase-like uncharacterized protein
MSDKHEDIVRRYYQALCSTGKMDISVIDHYVVEDFVAHDLPLAQKGHEGYKQFTDMFAASFSDINPIVIHDTFSCGDKVVARWSWCGKHSAEFMGIPATNRQITMKGINIFRLREGKLADLWQQMDTMGILQQISAPR